jgi:hypothetical protein
VEIDFRAFFYQFPLGEEVRQFFVFRVDDELYVPCRMPMGFSHAVSISHLSSLFLAHNLCEEVVVFVYVDNILILGDEAQKVRNALETFLQRCAMYGVTVGSQSTVAQSVIFRGIDFSLADRSLSMKKAFVEKLNTRLQYGCGEGNTWGETRSLISMLLYAIAILGIPLANVFHLLHFLIKHVSTSPRKRVVMWTEARKQWEWVLTVVRQNQKTYPMVETGIQAMKGVLVTDARGDGTLAAMKFQNGRVEAVRKHTQKKDIAVLEAQAIHLALSSFACSNGVWVLFCDNLAVLFALKKGWSQSYFLNLEIMSILQTLRDDRIELSLCYVPSEENCADPLTRYVAMSDSQYGFFSFVSNTGVLGVAEAARSLGLTTCQ